MQKEYSAKTLDEALELASKELCVEKESLKYQKLSENSFLGLFKSVKILVSVPENKEGVENSEVKAEKVKSEEIKVSEVDAETEDAINEDAEEEASEEINIAKDIVETINEETANSVNLGKSSDVADKVASEFVSNVLSKMGLEANVVAKLDKVEETVYVSIEGPDMGVLIGKRGQTLDSLQYLTSLVVNRTCNDMYLKVKLDTENYRERRKETLENLAKNISSKVRRTRRAVVLEPMNPYERRLIHSALQNDKYVETHSEGEEPYRRVVVTLKKDAPIENRRYNGRNGGKYGNSRNGKYRNNYYGKNKQRNYPRYNDKSDDYSEDYKADYAAYLESKAAAKAAKEEESK
ncbi:MAG: RNA-binding cell elongation regulator Jag/EloR [Lachnospiraceae bacterium]